MTIIITIACLISAIFFLSLLSIIDLKTRLLPNKYVAGFFLSGIIFHVNTQFQFTLPLDMFLGVLAGSGLLLMVRYIANKAYGKDTLGLGDVKLMGAAGVWLGMDYIFLALSIGAFAGLIHGLIYGYYKKIKLSTLSIPAGPGFIFGIIIVGIIKFQMLVIML